MTVWAQSLGANQGTHGISVNAAAPGSLETEGMTAVSVVTREIPRSIVRDELTVDAAGAHRQAVPLRHNTQPGMRAHFAFEIEAATPGGNALAVRLVLLPPWCWLSRPSVEVARVSITLRSAARAHVS